MYSPSINALVGLFSNGYGTYKENNYASHMTMLQVHESLVMPFEKLKPDSRQQSRETSL
jgi:hypothetical protein